MVELAVRWHLAYEAFDGLREDIANLVQVSKLSHFRWLEPVGVRLGDFLGHLLLDTAQAQRRFLLGFDDKVIRRFRIASATQRYHMRTAQLVQERRISMKRVISYNAPNCRVSTHQVRPMIVTALRSRSLLSMT